MFETLDSVKKYLHQVCVDLEEIAYQSGDCKDRQGDYISDQIRENIEKIKRAI